LIAEIIARIEAENAEQWEQWHRLTGADLRKAAEAVLEAVKARGWPVPRANAVQLDIDLQVASARLDYVLNGPKPSMWHHTVGCNTGG